MAAHRYWRLRIHSTHSADVWTSVATFTGWAATFDGDQLLSSLGVVCTASSTFGGFPATNANDNNSGTAWITGTFADPTDLKFDFGATAGNWRDIRQIQFTSRTDGFWLQYPKNIEWQWSDDDITYTTTIGPLNTPAPTGPGQYYTSASVGGASFERITGANALVAATVASNELRLSGGYVLTAINYPTPEEHTTDIYGVVTVKNTIPLRVNNAAVLVAVRIGAETHRLRAWTFTQDDHDFYVLGLGSLYPTLVLDLMTNQWSEWTTEGLLHWRASTGIAWDLENVAGDLTEGILWNISADDRRDDFSFDIADTRPIISIVRGLLPIRLRNALGCYRADLTVSEGAPAQVGVGITLRTSDDFGRSWHNHGFQLLDNPASTYEVQWSSLGLITAPGRIFEIEDTGYAARIDALDVDLGPDEGKVDTGG
jgi:hypothetical protein